MRHGRSILVLLGASGVLLAACHRNSAQAAADSANLSDTMPAPNTMNTPANSAGVDTMGRYDSSRTGGAVRDTIRAYHDTAR
jgi:hypothetical protein